MSHAHWKGGPTCDMPTKKACEARVAEWQAMQQVILAYRIVVAGGGWRYKKDKSQFGQLVRYIDGQQPDMYNDEGNPSQAPWVVRLRAAVERVKSGDIPGYNLYTPFGRSTEA